MVWQKYSAARLRDARLSAAYLCLDSGLPAKVVELCSRQPINDLLELRLAFTTSNSHFAILGNYSAQGQRFRNSGTMMIRIFHENIIFHEKLLKIFS